MADTLNHNNQENGISNDSQYNNTKHRNQHDEEKGHQPIQMVTLTAKEYESLFLTAKDARPATPITGTFANPVGIGTIALVLVVLPWSLALCELGGTNAVSLFVIAPAFIFSGFVSKLSIYFLDSRLHSYHLLYHKTFTHD